MKRKISLYIADQLVDLDDQSFILFNHTMEDLTNPTIVRNSYSQQVTLKGTPNNNRIFGDFFRLDRVTQYGASSAGVNFNAIRKTPFTIFNELNEIVESGYVKLDEVTRAKGIVEYKVTLFGGLGSFFYNLMYNEDGAKKTLADIRYRLVSGGYTRIPGHFGQFGGYGMVQDAWTYLRDPESYDFNDYDNWHCNIINFAPCYNGMPEDFATDRAVVKKASFDNMPDMSPKAGATSNIMVMSNKHTEWEMKDLRWYLQRPVFRVKALFDAICDTENNGGYEVLLDESFFNKDNDLYWNGWITLPMIPAKDRKEADAVVKLLSSMLSPAEYVISFAKMFGLVFLFDKARRVTILPRRNFFDADGMVDLTDRVNVSSIRKNPLLASSRFYQFGGGAIGEWASAYKADFGMDYAIRKVNTGNEFNNDTTIVTEGIVFKEAVDVQERNRLFVTEIAYSSAGTSGLEVFRLPNFEQVKVQTWSGEEMSEVDVAYDATGTRFYDNINYPLSDWLPKTQFHEAENKAIDGANVLLVFGGAIETPQWRDWARLTYRLTDDVKDMETLNEGQACWNFTGENSRTLTYLPAFRRCKTEMIPDSGDEVILSSYEWGEPLARGVNGSAYDGEPKTIYNEWWQKYQRDRFDDDTFSITCKVNLRGLPVGQELLRRFFFFQGAVFVMNKIINHSLTTWDDTECEFIKVQDISNYLN